MIHEFIKSLGFYLSVEKNRVDTVTDRPIKTNLMNWVVLKKKKKKKVLILLSLFES